MIQDSRCMSCTVRNEQLIRAEKILESRSKYSNTTNEIKGR